MVYRTGSAPIQPYAFTTTPSLHPAAQWQQFGNIRSSSAQAVPTLQSFEQPNGHGRSRHIAGFSMTSLPASAMGYTSGGSRDDSALPGTRRVAQTPRPQSSYMSGSAAQVSFTQATPVKLPPERYRRPAPRPADSSSSPVQQAHPPSSAPPSGSGMATVGHLYNSRGTPEPRLNAPRTKAPALTKRPNSFYGPVPGSAVDDIQLYRQPAQQAAKRIRRRSMPALDSADYPNPLTPHTFKQPEESSRLEPLSPPQGADKDQKTVRGAAANAATDGAPHAGNGSSESLVSSRSSNSRPSSVSVFLGLPPSSNHTLSLLTSCSPVCKS